MMSRLVDLLVMLALSGSFALLVTMHAALVAGLFAREPRWRGLVAFLVPPLAPYWGWEERMHFRSALWLLGLIGYALTVTAAALRV